MFGTKQIIDSDCGTIEHFYAYDIDNDNDNDIILSSTNGLMYYINDGTGTFGGSRIINVDIIANFHLADIDNDNDVDIVTGATIWYENNPKPYIYQHPVDNQICENTNTDFLISADFTTSYQWQVHTGSDFTDISNGGVYSGAETSNLIITEATLEMNNYQYRCVTSNSVGDSISSAAVLYIDELIVAQAGYDDSICDITQYQLDGNLPDAGTGIWTTETGGVTFENQTNYNTIVNNLPADEVVFKWEITNKTCLSFDEVCVSRFETVIANAGVNDDICKDTFYYLEANYPAQGTGLWTLVDGNGEFVNNTMYNTEVYAIEYGENIYQWTITNGNCFHSDDVTIAQNYIQINVQPLSQEIDEGEDVTFFVETEGDISSYKWFKDGTPLFDNAHIEGSSTNELTIYNTTSDDAGNYWCFIDGICGSIYSELAALSFYTNINYQNKN